jgi:hypothetical protein
VRQEIGWTGNLLQTPGSTKHVGLSIEEDLDSDWFDEPDNPIHSFSVLVARKLGLSNLSQSWAERLAQERFSWDQQMTKICEAVMEFNKAGPPSPESVSSSSSQSASFTILCIHLTGKFVYIINLQLITPICSSRKTEH